MIQLLAHQVKLNIKITRAIANGNKYAMHVFSGAFFDMYIGDVPVCEQTKEEIGRNVASIIGRC